MAPLDRKLMRDLWRIRSQAAAIGAVIAVGVLLLVMMTGLVATLDETRRAYYERYRLADIFAPVTRAPDHLLPTVAALPGVAGVEGRVQGAALVDLPGVALPVQAVALSLPADGAPRLNAVRLTAGRMIAPSHPDEILLLDGFAAAHGLGPGDMLQVTMNGARKRLRIVGLAQSPEFLFSTAPGELVPDDARFGAIWMGRPALAAAYDMDGAFSELLIGTGRTASEPAIIAAVDRLLAPFGGQGAYGRADHASDRFVTEEINGLRQSSRGVPPIFLAVAAFLLYIVIARIVQSEREQIGLLKAFGYTSREISGHYMKLVLVIATAGAVLGGALGILSGRALSGVYLIYYKFPFLVFQISPGALFIGILVSVAAASAGAMFVLRQVYGLTAAAAMRPPAPEDFSRSARIGRLTGWMDQPTRMVWRRITRQPWRIAGAVLGVAAGMALSAAMTSIMSGFDRTIDLSFDVMDRSDMAVSFKAPLSDKTVLELQRIPGVLAVEPARIVPAILSNGTRTYRGAVSGLVATPDMNRPLDAAMRPIHIRGDGLVLSAGLADLLDIRPGDRLTVDVREGRQPVLELPVAGIAETLLGAPAYLRIDALNRALGEGGRVSTAYLQIDEAAAAAVHAALKAMPGVAGVSVKAEARDAMQEMMDSGAGATRYIMLLIAAIITFGIVYNTASIAYAERSRDLASLRVIGFSRAEVGFVLLGELGVIALLAVPLGAAAGYLMSFGIAAGYSNDLYQIPAVFTPANYGAAGLAVLLATLASGLIVNRRLAAADLVASLKTRE
ncbi:ABC transporter permease [Oceanomicrobium pacificus]|uniref:FtsX-like permease family protein n=1 Tax=Oceanomicrobium pacificus TaxID=2692916 RepID=A0A6B0TSE8_9RHOB|nr:FtsX-like permease family protein [Oceanomicrobium pacificus]MXU63933.1 FtsX-like permease family protein [Oceanomicrobium pacificus]